MKAYLEYFFKKITELSTTEKETLRDILVDLIFKDKNTFEAKSTEYHLENCPHCCSKKYKKNGKNSNNIQTYQCKDCNKYFSSTTGSAIFRIQKKEKWYQYIELLFSGEYYSVRKSASIIEVNPNTVMRSYSYLQDKGIVYNKRGIGYFIAIDAYEKSLELKKEEFLKEEVPSFIKTMRLLKMQCADIEKIKNSLK